MGKLIKPNTDYPLVEVVGNIDTNKFRIPITEDILNKNGWESFVVDCQEHWKPKDCGDEDFDCFWIWFRQSKDAWCYQYSFGTYVYNIRSIGELELILGREGFIYEFEI